MNKKCNVLIPDGDSTWALSVMHCLSQVENYRIFVLSNQKRSPTKYSRYTYSYTFYERQEDATWLSIVNSEIQKHHISVVLPIAEEAFRFFIQHGEKLHASAKLVALPQLEPFDIAIHKNKLGAFASLRGIPHPKSFYIEASQEVPKMVSEVNFPILIKPLHQKGGDGIRRLNSEDEFPHTIADPIFVQEFIEGHDIDCSVMCQNGDILTYTIQKGNLAGSTTYAPQLGFDFIDNPDLFSVVKRVMSELKWSGVAHLDLRYDYNAKDYKLIEINARFWGSVQASVAAGVNFPHLLIQLALGHPIQWNHYEHTSYMRLKGVIKTIFRRPSFLFKWNYLMNNSEVKVFLKDPLPTFYRFFEWLRRRIFLKDKKRN